MSKRIITIGRQFGSNGHEIGMALARRLQIHCYDRELIELASKDLEIPYDQLKLVDEKRDKRMYWYKSYRYFNQSIPQTHVFRID